MISNRISIFLWENQGGYWRNGIESAIFKFVQFNNVSYLKWFGCRDKFTQSQQITMQTAHGTKNSDDKIKNKKK